MKRILFLVFLFIPALLSQAQTLLLKPDRVFDGEEIARRVGRCG